MMRYQRLSPDCAPLSNGRKSNLRVCKEDENGKTPNYSSPFEGKSNPRHNNNRSGSSPSSSPNQEPNFPSYFPPSSENHESTTTTTTTSPTRGGGGGDVLLQWGQHKRSRRSRVVTEESSAVVQSRKAIKIHRRVVEKQGILTHAMPPPPPPSSFPLCNTKRSSTTSRDNTTASHLNRNLEERPGPKNGSPSRNGGRVAVSRSALSPDNKAGGGSCSASIREEKANGSMVQVDHQHHNNFESSQLMDQEVGGAGAGAGGEKVNMEVFEWPRIYLSLSRKEKEDDFMAMKGTKLPQRPKKRAKNVDKTLQYCFPGMWLSDLTRGRYEVREKKCVKKQKRRGLKGMESMDTDSE